MAGQYLQHFLGADIPYDRSALLVSTSNKCPRLPRMLFSLFVAFCIICAKARVDAELLVFVTLICLDASPLNVVP